MFKIPNQKISLMSKSGNIKKAEMHVSYSQKNQQLLEKELTHTKELNQFSQLLSHYLRSPIVKIKSIINHIKNEEVIDKNHSTINLLDYVSKEADKLDEVIYDLNKILEIYSNQEIKKYVNLKRILNETLKHFESEITQSNAIIDADFAETRGVFTAKNYVQHIMDKLISNAIKYRSPDRQLIINIKTFEIGNYSCLMVKDNGLGIDLKKYKTKVFGLYNRFHEHVKGKGTGLYIVKAETESLGGNIQIESEVNEGTVFSIYFPKY